MKSLASLPDLGRRAGIVLLCLLVLLCSVPIALVSAEGDDGVFAGFSSWTVKNGTLALTDGVSGNGAQVTLAGRRAGELSADPIAVSGGTAYEIGAYVRSTAAAPRAALIAEYYADEDCTAPVGERVQIAAGTPGEGYTPIVGTANVPEGAHFLRVTVELGAADGSAAGDVYAVDDAHVYRFGKGAALYANAAACGYAAGAWFRASAAWSNNETRYMETVDEGYAGSAGALHIVNKAAAGDMWLGIIAPGTVTAGHEYTVSLRVKGSVATGGSTFRFGTLAVIDDGAINVTTADKTHFDDWTLFSYDFTSDGKNEFYFAFSQYNNESDIYIDDIRVTDKESGEDVLAGKGGFAAGDTPAVIEVDLLKNGGFEDVLYTYLPIDEFNGTFEGIAAGAGTGGWQLCDNGIGDTLHVAAGETGKHLVMTKGASAVADDGFVSLSTPMLAVDGGMTYRVSFDAKGGGQKPVLIATGYYFFDDGTAPQNFRLAPNVEGQLENGWTAKSGTFTVPANATGVQLRLIFRGAAGDTMAIDNVSVLSVPPQQVVTEPAVTIAAIDDAYAGTARWHRAGGWTNVSGSGMEIAAEGCDDPGSLHIVNGDIWAAGNEGMQRDMVLGIDLPGTAAGEYTVSLKMKGHVTYADQGFFFLESGNDAGAVRLLPAGQTGYDEWTTVTAKFTSLGGSYYLLSFSKYNNISDIYIDDLTITDENGRDMLNGAGAFCTPTLAAIDDAYAGTVRWHRAGGWANMTGSGMEIAAEGCGDAGSLHITHSDIWAAGNEAMRRDMVLGIDLPGTAAGEYTVSLKMKGHVTYADQGFFFLESGNDAGAVRLLPSGQTGYDEWTTVTAKFTSRGGSYYLLTFSQYNNVSDIYIDGLTITDENGNDMLQGAGTFRAPPVAKLMEIGDSYNGTAHWHRAGGWANMTGSGMEIAAEGCDDPGSLHIVHGSIWDAGNEAMRRDMVLGIDLPGTAAGEYTVSLKMKGHVTYADQGFFFLESGNDAGAVRLLPSGQTGYDEWTTVTAKFTSRGGSYYLLTFSQYNNVSDIYIDGLTVTDSSGNDMLQGAGAFCEKKSVPGTEIVTDGGFEQTGSVTAPGWTFRGPIDWNANDGQIELRGDASLMSWRYGVTGGDVYRVRVNGSGGTLRIAFDNGEEHVQTDGSGLFIVPEGAQYLRVYYETTDGGTLRSVGFSKVDDPKNFDFELKDPKSAMPLNWQSYVQDVPDGTFTVAHDAAAGTNGSGALSVRVEKDNGQPGLLVIYSMRVAAEKSSVYRVTFRGKYAGEQIGVFPLVRTYTAKGGQTQASPGYNWLTGANSANGDDAWHTYTADFSTGSDTAYLEMRFEIHAYQAGASFLFDDVSITRLGDADDANLDFESGVADDRPFNWTVYERREKADAPGQYEEGTFGAYEVKKIEGASSNGTAAAVIRKAQTGDVQLYMKSIKLPVDGDTNYLLSYDALSRGNKKGSIQICVQQFWDALGNGSSDESEVFYWLTEAYAYGSFDWRECGGVFKTAAKTRYVQIWLVVSTDEACEIAFDNVVLQKTDEVNDPNLDFDIVAGGKPVNWRYSTSDGIADITADSDVTYRGSHALHIDKRYSRINYSVAEMSRKIDVQAGDRIEFVIHMRSRAAVSGTFAAVINGYNENGSLVQTWNGQDRPLNAADTLSDWQEYRIPYTVTKNVRQVSLLLRIGGNADVYIDAIEYYNYTATDGVVYAEDFASASSDGTFGGWHEIRAQGAPTLGTNGAAVIGGDAGDNGGIYTDIDILNTGYGYRFTAHYLTTGTAEGRLVLEAYNWRDEKVDTVIDRALSGAASATEIGVDFTAVDAVYYRLRFEKTGGEGEVQLTDVQLRQTAQPTENVGWEGSWIVHPADYDTIESQKNNERYYYYRHEFNLEGKVSSAQLQITADDKADVYVNGELIYTEERTGDTWSLPVTLDLTEYLHEGKNVLAVRLYNGVYRYALLYDGIIKMENGSALRIVSDDSVMVARAAVGEDGTPAPEWSENDADTFMQPGYDMSTGGWVRAEIYARAGSGGWGLIDFDNAEYSDYKLQTNSFTFPKNTIYAGDTVEITAELTIEKALPTTSSFGVWFWKRNSTSRICSGTLMLADGETTDSWPVGKPFTAKFTLTVPQFLAAGSYTVQFSGDVAIVSDYFINNKVGNLKVAQLKQDVTTKSEVRVVGGKPTMFVNGVAKAPLWYSRPERDTQFSAAEMAGLAAGGVDTSIAFILPRETLGELWLEDGSLSTETIDRQILGTLAADPNSQLVMAIDTTPPQWWLDRHPDECVKMNNGTVSKESFASALWREETGKILVRIVDYLMTQPYANNIVGFKVTGGTTYEWQWWGINGTQTAIGDFSSVGLTAFRAWLRERYATVDALRAAWNDGSVTFDNAGVPDIAARSAGEFGSVLSAGSDRHAIDYALFMGDTKTDATLYFTRLIKQAVGDRLIVGTYAGYLLNVINYDMAASTSQTSFQKLLCDDSIDLITCPWLYSEREIGFGGDFMSTVDSVTAHGKLYIAEDDDRNHTTDMFEAPDARAAVGWTRTAEQTVETLKRNFSYALTKGCGLYLYSLAGTYFTDSQIQDLASAMVQEMTLSLGLTRTSVSDIAVFYDEQSAAYMPYSGADLTDELLYKSLLQYQRRELNAIGVPYDTYLLDDLESGLVPEHKINIMLSTVQVTASERRAIEERLCKNGNTVIWMFTSGLSDGESSSVDHLSALTGMHMRLVPQAGDERKLMGTVEVKNTDHYLTAGLADVSFGAAEYRTLAPVIAVDDPDAVALGYHTAQTGYDTDLVGLAVKEMERDGRRWTSVYCAVPGLPQSILRNLLSHSGCHIYDETASDVIYADGNYIAVHSLFGGEKTIELPKKCTVYDVFGRKIAARDVKTFTFTANGASTYLFRLSTDEDLRLYFGRTAGGSVSPEGLTTAAEGDSATLTFTPDEGYRLDHLMVDGVRTTVSGSSFTLTDIRESHTVIACFTKVYDKPPIDEPEEPDTPDGPDTPVTPAEPDEPNVPDTPDTPDAPDTPVTPSEPDEPDTPDTPDKPDDGKKPADKPTIKYHTVTEINWPAVIALGAGVLAGLAAVLLIVCLLCRSVVFYRGGKRIGAAFARRKGVRVDRYVRRYGSLAGITAVVKGRYVRRHDGQKLPFTANGAPVASAALSGKNDVKTAL